MPKGIHENYLNFHILDTNDLKSLVFVDASEYMENPEKPLLEATLPGMMKYVLVNINARKVNTFTSNTLNLTPEILNECGLLDLPDGVWTFKYKICPYQYVNRTKYYLRTTMLSQKIDSFLEKLDCIDQSTKEGQELKKGIIDIFILVESAKASAELGNSERATKKYNLADKKIDNLLCKTNC